MGKIYKPIFQYLKCQTVDRLLGDGFKLEIKLIKLIKFKNLRMAIGPSQKNHKTEVIIRQHLLSILLKIRFI